MENFDNFEYIIKPKPSAKNRLQKGLLITVYVLFVVSWLIFGLGTPFVALLALIPLTTWMLVFFTWRFVNVEYEYSASSGILTLSRIYGSSSRKRMLDFDLRKAQIVLPLSYENIEQKLNDFEPIYELFFISHRESPNAHVVLYKNEDGENCALYLEILPELMRSFKLYNSALFKNQTQN